MTVRINDVLLAGGAVRRQVLLAGLLGSGALGLALISLPLGIWSVIGLPLAFVPLAVGVKSAVESASGERTLSRRHDGTETRLEAEGRRITDVEEMTSSTLELRHRLDTDRELHAQSLEDLRAQLLGELDVLRAESGETVVRSIGTVAEVERVEARLVRIKDSITAKLDRATETADERHRATSRRIDRERESRHRAMAARDSTGRWPGRILLQMTINRTGSTRLFDVLRCHDDVYVEPLDFLWTSLGLAGRRYPVGLSDVRDSTTSIVSQDSIGVGIRSMRPAIAGLPDPASGRVAVEKAHPQFFDFDVETFVSTIDAVSREHAVEIDIVYQIRRPLDVMWSMAEYKQRDPSWHGKLTIDGIPALVRQEFEALELLHRSRPGLVIDFDDVSETSPTMLELGRLVAPDSSELDRRQWLRTAFAATSRSALATTYFVGQRQDRVADGPDDLWRRHSDDLMACDVVYQRLTEFRSLT